jgi:hypothetical protein
VRASSILIIITADITFPHPSLFFIQDYPGNTHPERFPSLTTQADDTTLQVTNV